VRLATFRAQGFEHGGEVRGDEVVAFAGGETVLDRLTSGDRSPATGPSFALAEVELLAPVPRPRAVFGVGLNYRAHAAEGGREAPPAPIVFLKLPSSVVAPNGTVDPPAAVRRRLDYEGEMAVVIGADGAVAGFAVADDLSARDLQKREPQWTRAKGFDASCPWGPWITTADAVDPGDLRLRTWLNGELRQDARTSDMIFGVDEVVAFLAEAVTLAPGDLVLTGTPEGVGAYSDPPRFLTGGDVVRVEVEGLGAIEHRIA